MRTRPRASRSFVSEVSVGYVAQELQFGVFNKFRFVTHCPSSRGCSERPLLRPQCAMFAPAANVRIPPILLKNNLLRVQNVER